jgi:predicted ABC-type ATPase
MAMPEALILAGPNGAGKTTASAELVPSETYFLNGDVVAARLIGQGHSPVGLDVAASRIILNDLREVVAAGKPFCIETNLAGRGLIRRIGEWRAQGYLVALAFVALDDPELALLRVAGRVAFGGHDVPEEIVRRRWSAGLRSLFDIYLPLVDSWEFYDNTDGELWFLAEGGREGPMRQIFEEERWGQFLNLAAQAGSLGARPGGEFFDSIAPVYDDGSADR